MDQQDLFSVNEQSTPVESISSTNVLPSETVVTEDDNTIPNIFAFAFKYQRDIWGTFKHRRDSLSHVSKFADYKNMGALPMDKITAKMILDYRKVLQETPVREGSKKMMTNGTINRHLSAISSVFRFALEVAEIIHDRPRIALLKQPKPNTRAFTRDQVDTIVNHLRDDGLHWIADMVILGCKTGMRQGEITSLNLDIIEWDHAGKEILLPGSITKTNEARKVSLAAPGAYECALRLKECIGREYSAKRFYNAWWDVKERMGYKGQDWFKFHATRHTAASNMANANVNSFMVAEQLGHASVTTTQKYYHGTKEARAEAVSCL